MSPNEQAVWSAIFQKCQGCFTDKTIYPSQATVGDYPPYPEELAGYLKNSDRVACDYCKRMSKTQK